MSILKKTISFIFLLSFFIFAAEEDKNLTGKEIAERVEAQSKKLNFLIIRGEIEMVNLQSQRSEKRHYTVMSRIDNNRKSSIFRFTDSIYKNTTFLSLEQPDGSRLQYIWLKSVGSPRQIEGSDKDADFVDTDISNEEIGGFAINDYIWNRIEDRTIDNRDCYVIERVPVRKNARYSKYVVFIDKEYLVTLLARVYGKDNRMIKIIKSSDIRKVGETYMAFFTEVVHSERKRKTIVRIIEAIEKEPQKTFFRKEMMDSPWQ